MQITSKTGSLWQHLRPNIAFSVCILAITIGLKQHYSLAGSDALDWILGPTAGLAEIIGGIPFEHEALTGYISRDARAVIAPACAGVNFMIMAFGMIAFQGVFRLGGSGRRLVWLVAALGGAYLLTILVNAVRITISIYLYGADLYDSHVTPADIHRAAEVLIYFAALATIYPVSGKIIAGLQPSKPARRAPVPPYRWIKIRLPSLVPLLWYTAITLVVPILRRLEIAGQPQFQKHVLTVLTVALLVFSIFLIGQLCYHHIKTRCKESWPKTAGFGLPLVRAYHQKTNPWRGRFLRIRSKSEG